MMVAGDSPCYMHAMGYHVSLLLPFRLVSGLFGSSLYYFESYKNMLRENNMLYFFMCVLFSSTAVHILKRFLIALRDVIRKSVNTRSVSKILSSF